MGETFERDHYRLGHLHIHLCLCVLIHVTYQPSMGSHVGTSPISLGAT
jgi:hypothetical protein